MQKQQHHQINQNDKTYQVLLIRHAQSIQNKRKKKIKQSLSVEQLKDLQSHPQYLSLKFSPQYMDAELSQTGIQQAKQAKKLLQNTEVDIIVVSPLLRALQTCQIIFGDRIQHINHHETQINKQEIQNDKKNQNDSQNKNIRVYVQPLLAQVMYAACDIGSNIQQSHKSYQHKYCFNRLKNEELRHWYIANIGEKSRQKIQKLKQQQQKQPQQQNNYTIHDHTLAQMKENNGLESAQDIQNRCALLRQKLREYAKKSKKKMAVVGHYCIFKNLTNLDGYDQSGNSKGGIQLWNAQFKQYTI